MFISQWINLSHQTQGRITQCWKKHGVFLQPTQKPTCNWSWEAGSIHVSHSMEITTGGTTGTNRIMVFSLFPLQHRCTGLTFPHDEDITNTILLGQLGNFLRTQYDLKTTKHSMPIHIIKCFNTETCILTSLAPFSHKLLYRTTAEAWIWEANATDQILQTQWLPRKVTPVSWPQLSLPPCITHSVSTQCSRKWPANSTRILPAT